LDLADSEYVAWLDSGDIWYPKKISLQIKAINTQLGDFTSNLWATCSYDWKQSGLADREKIQDPGSDSMRALLEGRSFRAYLWTIVSRRQAMTNVGYFDENLPRLQDLDFFIRFILNGGEFVQPLARTALCAYFKEHRGRDAQQIENCNEYIRQKYDFIYCRYGRKFKLDCELRAVKNSIRFAVANEDGYAARKYKQHALVLRLKKLLTTWV
jgi:glycosyltransferase involved in cell wall biosynthesis